MSLTQQTPPRRSHGCLWGCLAVLLIFFLPVVLAGGYGTWFLWQGFRNDPVLRTVAQLTRKDGLARRVLGDGIHVTGVGGNAFSFVPGQGSHADYEVAIAGDRAAGVLDVESDTSSGKIEIRSMTLTLPDGGRYDLLHDRVLTEPSGSVSI
ncbi:MAG TPA: cytochrome c oxidase assembly factor Coa1 family protein [Rhizomicrobium sp.]|jgi:hypothetical protein